MPRRPRVLPVGRPAHVIQRGNNRQICFASDQDIAAYANWLDEGARKYGVLIHAWVFMANHAHLLTTPAEEEAISRCIQHVGRYYVRYFNYRYRRTGALFEDRFKSHPVQTSQYYLVCSRYIELNPVRAGMVTDPALYKWSSYGAQALGRKVKMWSPHAEYENLGATQNARQIAYRREFETELDSAQLSEIKCAQETGFVLGSDKFRLQFEELTGLPQSFRKRGRKPKTKL